MAKRRMLKKCIGYIAGDLFTEVLVCKMLIPGVEHDKIDSLLTQILDLQEEFIRRAHHPAGKDNKKLVKEYYQKLLVDFEIKANAIAKQVENLRNEKGA